MKSKISIYSKYFWDLSAKALKETEKIINNPKHSKFIPRMVALLSRCHSPKELFSLISQENFIKYWPRIKSYWKKIAPYSDFRDWWQTIYESLLEKEGYNKYKKFKGRPSQISLKIGKVIREARVQKNLTQKELGVQVGISQPDISMIEEGKKNITIETLFRLCKVLGIKKIEF